MSGVWRDGRGVCVGGWHVCVLVDGMCVERWVLQWMVCGGVRKHTHTYSTYVRMCVEGVVCDWVGARLMSGAVVVVECGDVHYALL